MNKILISFLSFGQCGPESINIFKQQGFETTLNPYERILTQK